MIFAVRSKTWQYFRKTAHVYSIRSVRRNIFFFTLESQAAARDGITYSRDNWNSRKKEICHWGDAKFIDNRLGTQIKNIKYRCRERTRAKWAGCTGLIILYFEVGIERKWNEKLSIKIPVMMRSYFSFLSTPCAFFSFFFWKKLHYK